MIFMTESKALKTELYRKAVHLSSLWIPLLIMLAEKNFCIILFSVLVVLDLTAEYNAYRKTSVIGTLFRRLFIKTLRNKEVSRISFVPSGSVYILAAALAVSVCFSPKAAAAAMCIVLTADSNAALIGRFFGTFRFYNGKSFEGTMAFFVSSVLVILFFYPEISPAIICLTATVATAAEFFEKEIGTEDNFALPLLSGFILNLVSL